MRLLITNDDGIDSALLHALVGTLRAAGHDLYLTPMCRTVPAQVILPQLFSPAADDGTHRFVFQSGEDISPGGVVTDRAALHAGQISHSVLDYSRLGVM
jgi:hypothetical protein